MVPGFVALGACGSATGPGGECEVSGGLEICVDRGEYAPGNTVRLTLTNRAGAVTYVDTCATVFVERTTRAVFGSTYNPERRCGADPAQSEIVANMHTLEPGQATTESLRVTPGIPQGFYRIDYWILDSAGDLQSEDPVSSSEFDVFPSAG